MPEHYYKNFEKWLPVKAKIDADQKYPTINKRDIWWCSIGVNIGVEQDGKNELFERPVLVVRKFNARHFMGVPLTTQLKDYPFRCNIFYRNPAEGRVREGQAILSQMRSFDTSRLTRQIARLGHKQFDMIIRDIHTMLNN